MQYVETLNGYRWENDDGSCATTEEILEHKKAITCMMCGGDAEFVKETKQGMVYKCCTEYLVKATPSKVGV